MRSLRFLKHFKRYQDGVAWFISTELAAGWLSLQYRVAIGQAFIALQNRNQPPRLHIPKRNRLNVVGDERSRGPSYAKELGLESRLLIIFK